MKKSYTRLCKCYQRGIIKEHEIWSIMARQTWWEILTFLGFPIEI